ncbi:MAG: L-serine ammonia-lyase, iron-sulfur-dependent, subunit alpha [Sphingobacteriaceae bacterium]|nr:L-serine ammonia-lyase, iron-sulfur-dependent, subunit alpha [Sphingobacteriaceae bacterium]
MEFISVFDMLKIGVGPSSSHTLGPWRAAQKFIEELKEKEILSKTNAVQISLFGSLSLTGKGHATDLAVLLGLNGQDPVTIPIENIHHITKSIATENILLLDNKYPIAFSVEKDILFNKQFLPFHANALTFTAQFGERSYSSTFYSIGGGFVVKENIQTSQIKTEKQFPFPIQNADQLLEYCIRENKKISEIVFENEKVLRSEVEVKNELTSIWNTMLECMYLGCHTEGTLPGGLSVKRRAFDIHKGIKGSLPYSIRVVTAPTNGSAGVIPSVLMYYLVIENHKANKEHINQFLLVAGELGSIFKKGATISAAMGGCQAEIGVSSAMAAGALCELMGGTPEQVLMAAEIAMEHHLGLTCDPIAGLVQIPCIERNAMGAIKAINAAELAMETDAKNAIVPLDKVIATMWETAKAMNSKFKETSEGGLAVAVNLPDC